MGTAGTKTVITASRLSDGSVSYLGRDREWVSSFTDAELFDDAARGEAELSWAKRDEHHVCNAYAFEVQVKADGSHGLSSRERFRRDGAERARARLGY